MTWSARGRLPVAPDEATRRALVRAIVARAGAALALFCVVDDHVHVVLLCDAATRVKVVRALGYALGAVSAAPLDAPHVQAVERRAHAEHLVRYLLVQPSHHGLATHVGLWSGSCLPDLVGARELGWGPRVWDALPRLRLRDVHAIVGLPAVRLEPVEYEVVREAGPVALAAAASAALGADPALAGRATEVTRAVTAAAHLSREVGLSLTEVGAAMGRTRETVSRAADREVDAKAVRAVRLRLALERAVAGSTGGCRAEVGVSVT